jgi:hypothetical protein
MRKVVALGRVLIFVTNKKRAHNSFCFSTSMCAPGYGKHIGKGVDAAVGFGIAGFVVAIAALLYSSGSIK